MHTRNGALATIALLLVDALALSAGPNSSEPAISSVAEPTSAIRPADQQAPSRRGIRFHGGTGRELGVVGWALERYRVADLDLPPVGISFHEDPSGCRDNSGFYARGQLDLCLQGQTRAYARKVVVHELAHAWSAANLSALDRSRFLRLRGLPSWNAPEVAWAHRGFEQAAEVLAWGIGDRRLAPLIPDDDGLPELETAFEVLTGRSPPREAFTRAVRT